MGVPHHHHPGLDKGSGQTAAVNIASNGHAQSLGCDGLQAADTDITASASRARCSNRWCGACLAEPHSQQVRHLRCFGVQADEDAIRCAWGTCCEDCECDTFL